MGRQLAGNTLVAGLLAGAVALVSAAPPSSPTRQRESRERQILVSVSSSDSQPLTGLTTSDFIVREDGLAREILSVATAPAPTHIALLIDDSQASQTVVPFLRSSLDGFVKKLSTGDAATQWALMTFGERPTRRVDYTTKPGTVQQAAAKVFPIAGSGAYFMQAIMDACQDLRRKSAERPVIVAFVAESGPEFSSETRKQVATALQNAGASLWVVVLQDTRNDDLSPEARERAAIIGDVTTDSGGFARFALSGQSLEPAFDGIAALLASRYVVRYNRPEQLIPPKSVEVTSKRAGVRVIASRWAR
jgi:hypothetical protein